MKSSPSLVAALPQTHFSSSHAAQPVRVGVLEDEPAMRNLLSKILAPEFKLWFASSGMQLRSAIEKKSVDIVLLDVLLPGEDGVAIAKSIRARSDVPLILISGLSSSESIATGLNVGADDYVTKPFQAPILRARMINALRRAKPLTNGPAGQPRHLTINGCTIDWWSQTVTNAAGATIKLTEKELQLLAALAREMGNAVDRNILSRLLNGQEWSPLNRCLDVHICHLRKKFKVIAGDSRMIASFRGIGYALKTIQPGDLRGQPLTVSVPG